MAGVRVGIQAHIIPFVEQRHVSRATLLVIDISYSLPKKGARCLFTEGRWRYVGHGIPDRDTFIWSSNRLHLGDKNIQTAGEPHYKHHQPGAKSEPEVQVMYKFFDSHHFYLKPHCYLADPLNFRINSAR